MTSASVWSAAGVPNGLVCVCTAWWLLSLCASQRWQWSRTPWASRWAGAGHCVRGFVPVPRRLGAFSALLVTGEVREPCLALRSCPSTGKSWLKRWFQGKWNTSCRATMSLVKIRCLFFQLVGDYMVWQVSSVPDKSWYLRIAYIISAYWFIVTNFLRLYWI